MKLLIATSNPGKAREFRQMLGDGRFEWSDLADHPSISVEETGDTFRANACLKAAGYAKQFSTWTLADDSGLEVDALAGKPGVHSARWAEINHAGKCDGDNNLLLLRQLKEVPDERRTARFVCVLALANQLGQIILTARDTVEGRIIHQPRGANGFGYDPLFLIDSLGKTTAELDPDQKHAISHRGKALRHLKQLMAHLLVCLFMSFILIVPTYAAAPATQQAWAGRYVSDEMELELTRNNDGQINGKFQMNGTDFPLTASGAESLSGTFRGLDGKDVAFTATMQGLHLYLEVNQHHYDLTRKPVPSSQPGEPGGIGVALNQIAPGGPLLIQQILPDSAAEMAGLKPGDQILEIDEKPMAGLGMAEAVQLIRGPSGNEIKLKIQQTDGTQKDMILTRKPLKLPDAPPVPAILPP